jgi:hypothetical protein
MNYYEVLNLDKTAAKDEIVQVFRRLAKEYHPDLNKSSDSKTRFINIYEAYSILKDDEKRKAYDALMFSQDKEPDKKNAESESYNSWRENAQKEAKYYSETKYKEFSDKVLKNIIVAAKFSKKILGFFALLIICGLVSIIIREILNSSINTVVINSNNSSGKVILPLLLDETADGWERIYIKDAGSFDIPPTMEIQNDSYQELVEKMGYVSQITAQQKGLNALDPDSLQKYARVMFNTELGNPGDFLNIDFNIFEITKSELDELNKMFRQQTTQGFQGTELKLREWIPLKAEKINGMSCIHISYIRQLNNNPSVLVNMYLFHNNDRIHKLTLSYRTTEEDYWKNDFENILKSFRITNIIDKACIIYP